MNKTIMFAVVICFVFSVSEIMASGTATRMRRALNRAWKAHMAQEKAFDREAARLQKELKDMDRKLFDVDCRDGRTR